MGFDGLQPLVTGERAARGERVLWQAHEQVAMSMKVIFRNGKGLGAAGEKCKTNLLELCLRRLCSWKEVSGKPVPMEVGLAVCSAVVVQLQEMERPRLRVWAGSGLGMAALEPFQASSAW